jgi:hypothetical protein
VGIDSSFGSSKFGIVATRFVNERIEVVISEEYDRPDFNAMINRIFQLRPELGNISAIYVDAANPEMWQSLKKEFNETYNDRYVFDKLAYHKKNNLDPANYMKIIPVPFSTMGASMLQHTKALLEDPYNLIAIDKRFDKLLTSLHTAVINEYKLSKEETSYHDILETLSD